MSLLFVIAEFFGPARISSLKATAEGSPLPLAVEAVGRDLILRKLSIWSFKKAIKSGNDFKIY
jgi:hypothetical protein